MNIDDLTIGQVRQLAEMLNLPGRKESHSCSFKVGESYLIRTATMIQTGRVVAITDSDIRLEDAAWIADTGRFSAALETGDLNEIEPFPHGCFVSRTAIIDVSPWFHPLPREVK